MKEEKDKLRDFMQGVFQDYEVKPDPDDWNRIEKTLSKKKSRRIIPWIIWASAASLLLLLAIYTGDILTHTEKGNSQTAINRDTTQKTLIALNQKTKLTANEAMHTNTAQKQLATNLLDVKINPLKGVAFSSSPLPKHNTVKGVNIIDNDQKNIAIVASNESVNSFRNSDMMVHAIKPKSTALIKYPNLSVLKNSPVTNRLTRDLMANNVSDIHFKGLSLNNSSGLIIQNSSGNQFMSYSGSLASQVASNLYLGSVLSFNIANPASINIGSLFENQSRSYLPPVTLGLNINLSLQPNWSIETGIQYTRLQSKGTVSISSSSAVQLATIYSYAVDENLYYIGIPLIIDYTFSQKRKTSCYWSAGLSIEKGLTAKYIANPENNLPGMATIYSHNPIKGLQYTLSSGMGISYKFIRHFEVFGQPSLSYYFNSLGNKTTIYSVHPLLFNLRSGIRYTIK